MGNSESKSGGSGGGGGGDEGSKMTLGAASRIQSAADRNPSSASATSGFKERAQSSAAKNEKN